MLTITAFVAQDSRLFAIARFIGGGIHTAGSVCIGALPAILLPARIRKSSADVLRVELGPVPIEMLDVRAELSPATLNIIAYPDPLGARRGMLSAISQMVKDPSTSLDQLVCFLNHLLAELP